jgi:hypothetical protein
MGDGEIDEGLHWKRQLRTGGATRKMADILPKGARRRGRNRLIHRPSRT